MNFKISLTWLIQVCINKTIVEYETWPLSFLPSSNHPSIHLRNCIHGHHLLLLSQFTPYFFLVRSLFRSCWCWSSLSLFMTWEHLEKSEPFYNKNYWPRAPACSHYSLECTMIFFEIGKKNNLCNYHNWQWSQRFTL